MMQLQSATDTTWEVPLGYFFAEYHTGWNRLQYSALYHCMNLLAVTPSGDKKTVANISQDWANGSLEVPSWLYSCIGWSSLLNHLTDGVSFTLHCCWHRFVLKTLLQLPIPDRSKYTEGVVGDRKMMQLWRDCFKRCELMRSPVILLDIRGVTFGGRGGSNLMSQWRYFFEFGDTP